MDFLIASLAICPWDFSVNKDSICLFFLSVGSALVLF
jgi:hypothetical protein